MNAFRVSREGNDPNYCLITFNSGAISSSSHRVPVVSRQFCTGLWNDPEPTLGSKYTIKHNTDMTIARRMSCNRRSVSNPIGNGPRPRITGSPAENYGRAPAGWFITYRPLRRAPIDGPAWGMWPSGGAWLCLHLGNTTPYSGDRNTWRRIPLLKGAAHAHRQLVEDPRIMAVTNPSLSPENHTLSSRRRRLCWPTMDIAS